MIFILGFEYTREAIHAECGGSLQSYLPHKDGVVVAACLNTQLNPRAPIEILCGNGLNVRQAGDLLAKQWVPIPIFIKRTAHHWIYQGRFQVAQSFAEPVDYAPYIANSGRDPTTISRVILLKMA